MSENHSFYFFFKKKCSQCKTKTGAPLIGSAPPREARGKCCQKKKQKKLVPH